MLVGSSPPSRKRALLDERAALALRAEPEVFQRQQQHVGERVVELGDVDVGGRDAGARERQRPADRGRADRHVVPLARSDMCEVVSPVPSTHTGLLRRSFARSCADQHDRRAAVAADAAVQLGEWVGDHRPAEHVIDRDRVAVVRLGIVRRR